MTEQTKRCPWRVDSCPDDMCRNSVERGLCGKYVEGESDDYDDGDDWDAQYMDDLPDLESWAGA